MGIGADQGSTAERFVEAMRPIAGDNVDLPQVRANLDALGLAVYRTLTADAETASDAVADAAFWQWIRDVQRWIDGVATAIDGWAAATPAEAALKAALSAVPAPAAAPSALKGRIA
ncbi:hypothetical protein [Kitasatospora sp. NPDC047058]|uniref:hypothetical protein n=1 Tax=Kitasatospora sp. NPDC047058 TaxID=3155620 RepID=UPI0033F48133